MCLSLGIAARDTKNHNVRKKKVRSQSTRRAAITRVSGQDHSCNLDRMTAMPTFPATERTWLTIRNAISRQANESLPMR
jgi:hypothetical protein